MRSSYSDISGKTEEDSQPDFSDQYQLNIDIERLQSLFSNGFDKVKSVEGKDVVLVIGNTKSGKSTTIGYLMGRKFREVKVASGSMAVPEDEDQGEKYPVVGSSEVNPETFIPYPFTDKTGTGITFLDTPGFERSEEGRREEKICHSILTQMAVSLTKSISSIVIAIDVNSFHVDAADSLDKLNKTLGALFRNPEETSPSILFVITKARAKNSEQKEAGKKEIIETIRKYIDKEKSTINRLQKLFSSKKDAGENVSKGIISLNNKLKICQLMEQNIDNILLINVFNEDSKNEIVDHLKKLRPVSKTVFNFNQYDDDRLKFNHLICEASRKGFQLMRKENELSDNVEKNRESINKTESEIRDFRKRIDDLQKNIEKLESNMRNQPENKGGRELEDFWVSEIRRIEIAIREKLNHKTSIEEKIEKLEEEIRNLQEQLAYLDQDTLEVYWKDFVGNPEKRKEDAPKTFFTYLQSFLWTRKEFNYKDIPFNKVREKYKEGRFDVKDQKNNAGLYNAIYESNYFQHGYARVTIWVARNQIPANKARIENIKNQIKSKIDKRNKLYKKLEVIKREIDNDNNLLKQYKDSLEQKKLHQLEKESLIEEKNKIIKNCEAEIKYLESRIHSSSSELESRKNKLNDLEKNLESVRSSIQEKKTIFDIVKKLSFTRGMNFDSHMQNLMFDFSLEYEKFLSRGFYNQHGKDPVPSPEPSTEEPSPKPPVVIPPPPPPPNPGTEPKPSEFLKKKKKTVFMPVDISQDAKKPHWVLLYTIGNNEEKNVIVKRENVKTIEAALAWKLCEKRVKMTDQYTGVYTARHVNTLMQHFFGKNHRVSVFPAVSVYDKDFKISLQPPITYFDPFNSIIQDNIQDYFETNHLSSEKGFDKKTLPKESREYIKNSGFWVIELAISLIETGSLPNNDNIQDKRINHETIFLLNKIDPSYEQEEFQESSDEEEWEEDTGKMEQSDEKVSKITSFIPQTLMPGKANRKNSESPIHSLLEKAKKTIGVYEVVLLSFTTLEDTKQFQKELFKIGIENLGMTGQSRKFEETQEGVYMFRLSAAEYNSFMEDDSAFDHLVTNMGTTLS